MCIKYGPIVAFLLIIFTPLFGIDMRMIKISGDGSKYGMKIESASVQNNSFTIETTGAIFNFDGTKSLLSISQKIGADRKLVSMSIGTKTKNLALRKSNDDHVLLSSDRFNIGIYGDSMLILQSLYQGLEVSYTGDFKPDYSHTAMDEWLLMDTKGGVGVFPQWYDAGFQMKMAEPDKADWVLKYSLNTGQRLLTFAFPARPFNYEQSVTHQTIFTVGYPPDDVIEAWSKYGNVLVLMHGVEGSPFYGGEKRWLGVDAWWENRYPGAWEWTGPWKVNNPEQMARVVKKAHDLDMKVIIYTSAFFHYDRPDADSYIADSKKALDNYNIDGFYIDGLYWEATYKNGKSAHIDEIKSWEVIRRMREMVGPDGILYFHGSAHGTMDRDMCFPTIDSYADFVLYGENYDFTKYKPGKEVSILEHPHVQFIIRKRNISNTIGMMKCYLGSNYARPNWTDSGMINAMWSQDNRMRWGVYPDKKTGLYPKEPDENMKLYFEKLSSLKEQYISCGD